MRAIQTTDKILYKQYGQVTKFEIDNMELFYIRPKIENSLNIQYVNNYHVDFGVRL